ncbi:uncharacterized protein LOC113361608 isoform X2 [Papaver somniferum]|uniref:uncharacterized protein LOC113361608 isoform X2 n=1 Tax=Papaver somniferum TaxID=3469 RepID=UPI000E704A46|nr:uncharacterized protein LOC113361608 isoform X2 [Papaver somniferum]
MSEKHGEESKPICRRYQYQSGPVKVELRLSNCSGTDSESTNKQTNGGMEALIVVQSPKCVFQVIIMRKEFCSPIKFSTKDFSFGFLFCFPLFSVILTCCEYYNCSYSM